MLHIGTALAVQQHAFRAGTGVARTGLFGLHHALAAIERVKARDVVLRNQRQPVGACAVTQPYQLRAALAPEGKNSALRQRHLPPQQVQQVLGHGVALPTQLLQQGAGAVQRQLQAVDAGGESNQWLDMGATVAPGTGTAAPAGHRPGKPALIYRKAPLDASPYAL